MNHGFKSKTPAALSWAALRSPATSLTFSGSNLRRPFPGPPATSLTFSGSNGNPTEPKKAKKLRGCLRKVTNLLVGLSEHIPCISLKS